MTLYFERDWNLIRDVYPYAQKMATKYGWRATQGYFAEKTQETGRSQLDAKLDGKLITALITAMVEAHLARMHDPYCWQEILQHPEVIGWINFHTRLTRTVDKNGGLIGLQQAWQERCHKRAGTNVYEPSLGLSEKLRNTKLAGLTTDDLKLPYESVYIIAPENLGLKVYDRVGLMKGRDSEWCDLEAVYITEGRDAAKGGLRTWTVMAIGKGIDGQPFSESLLFMNLDLPEGVGLDQSLSENRDRMMKLFGKDGGPGYDEVYKKLEKSWWEVFHWAMNLVLYLTLPDADIATENANKGWRDLKARVEKLPPGKKRDDLKARLKTLNPDRRIYVGRSVRFDGATPEAGQGRADAARATRVAGHWRNQAHGPRHTLRRLQWIEPFWRNLDGLIGDGKTTRVVL